MKRFRSFFYGVLALYSVLRLVFLCIQHLLGMLNFLEFSFRGHFASQSAVRAVERWLKSRKD
jgi:hypothetical protein